MERNLSGCRKVFVLILAVILVLMVPITYFTFNVGRVVFNATLVKRVFGDVIAESDLVTTGLTWFSEWRAKWRVETGLARPNEDEPDIVQLIAFLDREDWRAIRAEILPDEFVVSWVGSAVDGTYAWLDTRSDLPDIVLDLAEFKARVASDHGKNAVIVAYQALPPCSQAQISDFRDRLASAPAGTQVLYNLCRFPDPWQEDQFNDYQDSLQEVVQNLPDSFPIVRRLQEDEAVLLENVTPRQVKNTLIFMRLLLRGSLAAPLILVLLIVLYVPRSRKQASYWIGVPLVLGALLTLPFSLTYRWMITRLLVWLFTTSVTPEVLQEATSAALRLAAEIFIPITMMALGTVVLGGVVIAFGATTKEEIRAAEAEEEEEEEVLDLVGGMPRAPRPGAQTAPARDTLPSPTPPSAETTPHQPPAPPADSPDTLPTQPKAARRDSDSADTIPVPRASPGKEDEAE